MSLAEQASNTARGTPKGLADLRLYSTRQASMSRGVEARGAIGPEASRAPSVPFSGSDAERQETAYLAPQRIGAMMHTSPSDVVPAKAGTQ